MLSNKEAETMKSQFDSVDSFRKELREKDAAIENLKNQIESLKSQIRERDEMVRNLRNQK
jgi:peptidoglycan hydrolase CwlO-like protein